jgi:DNA-binding IscR family transcriptional regulator
MRSDNRLTIALHMLLHMNEVDRPINSETFAPAIKANPVVVRRAMAGLRNAGIVRSQKGHGGGWSLARSLASVTLADVYEALGLSAPFRIGQRNAGDKCVLERAVNRVLAEALTEAEALLVERLRTVTVAHIKEGQIRKQHRRRN